MQCTDQGARGSASLIQLLFGDVPFAGEGLKPFHVALCTLPLRHVAGYTPLCLVERRLERARVDLEEHLARRDLVTFLEVDMHKQSADLGLHCDRLDRFHCTGRPDQHWNVSPADLDRIDRNRRWRWRRFLVASGGSKREQECRRGAMQGGGDHRLLPGPVEGGAGDRRSCVEPFEARRPASCANCTSEVCHSTRD